MSVVLIEGFDHHDTTTILTKGWSSGPSTMPAGRLSSGYCARSANSASNFQTIKTLPSTYSEVILGFAFKCETIGNTTGAARVIAQLLTSANSVVADVAYDTSKRILLRNSSGTTVCQSSASKILVDSQWTYIEVRVKVNGASGQGELYVDGVSEVVSTTGNFGSTNIGAVAFYRIANVGTSAAFNWDDAYLVETSTSPNITFLADPRVETLFPNGNGTTQQWTASAGSAYQAIDETTPDTTDYITTDTVSNSSTFTMTDLSSSTATVHAVQTNLYAAKTAGGARTLKPVIRQGSTNYDGTATSGLSTSYSTYTQIWNQDPTNNAWTAANVNANEFGVKVNS